MATCICGHEDQPCHPSGAACDHCSCKKFHGPPANLVDAPQDELAVDWAQVPDGEGQ